MHACASFKIEDFNKDCHLLGDHARALPLIKREALAWSKGYNLVLCTSMQALSA